MLKLKKSPREEKMGCLFGLLGILTGLMFNNWNFREYARELRATDPDIQIDGLPYVSGMLGAIILGGLGGALVGMLISRFFMRKETEDE